METELISVANMEKSPNKNVTLELEVEVNCLKSEFWKLTNRVCLLEDFIRAQFGQVLGSTAPQNVTPVQPCSTQPNHSSSDEIATKTFEVIIEPPSNSISSLTHGRRKRKTPASSPSEDKYKKNKVKKSTKIRKTTESNPMRATDVEYIQTIEDVDSYDIDDSENDVLVLIPKIESEEICTSAEAVQVKTEDMNEEEDSFQSNFIWDTESHYAEENEINSIDENDFIVFIPKKTTDDIEQRIENEYGTNIDIPVGTVEEEAYFVVPKVVKVVDRPRQKRRGSKKKVDVDDGGSSSGRKHSIRKRGEGLKWTLEETFEDENSATESLLRNDWDLRVDFTKLAPGGKKVFYKCQNSCNAKAYLLIPKDKTQQISLFTNNVPHSVHLKSRGINKFVRLRIRKLIEKGVLLIKDIQTQLSQENIPLPERKKLKKFLEHYRAKKGNVSESATLNVELTNSDSTFAEEQQLQLPLDSAPIVIYQ